MAKSNNEMTLTLTNQEVELEIVATGNFTIEWGDDTSEQFTGNGTYSNYARQYPNSNKRTIQLTGDDITWLRCHGNNLTSLDVSKNSALIWLDCHDNQLTSLDVSNNTALIGLACSFNQLTSLNVDKNKKLVWLHCENNKLTSLDVSKNTELTEFGHDDDLKVVS